MVRYLCVVEYALVWLDPVRLDDLLCKSAVTGFCRIQDIRDGYDVTSGNARESVRDKSTLCAFHITPGPVRVLFWRKNRPPVGVALQAGEII